MDNFLTRYWLSFRVNRLDTLNDGQSISLPAVWLLLFIFLSISFIAFVPSYTNSFLTDDYKHLGFIQPFIDRPYTIYQAFNPYFLGWYYRPTQFLFFTFFRLLFGVNPLPYYAGMLILHAVNIILVYFVARIWGNGRFGAIFAAGLFSVVATHQETIGWISAVSVLLAATFSLLSFYNLRAYLNNPQQKKHLIITFLMAALAIFSREETVILFPLILFVWFFSIQRRPKRSEIWLFAGFGLFIITYGIIIFLRPTWTPHAESMLDRSLGSIISIQNLGQYILTIFNSYLSVDIQSNTNWLITTLVFGVMLLTSLIFWQGNSFLRLSILWTTGLFLLLYIIVWLLTPDMADRYLYRPWIGISFIFGALADQAYQKYPTKYIIPIVASFVLIGIFVYQVPLSRQQQLQRQNDADITTHNADQIKNLVPEINDQTHFFAYNMPPVTDYIQAMAAVWYDRDLGGRGGSWKRLMKSGFATSDDYLFNYEEEFVYNIMPELQEYEKTIFVWQETPTAEIMRADNTTIPLDLGAYQLNQIVGSSGQERFGFFIHPPAPEDGWASLSYTTAVPNNSDLMFGIRKEWGSVSGEDGMTFRVNIVDNMGVTQTIYHESLDTITEDWLVPRIPMDKYWQQTITVQFQVHANNNLLHDHGYWANPRFITSSPDESIGNE